MNVCLFGGQHKTVLPTAQPVPASPSGNDSQHFQELSNHSLQIPLGSGSRPHIAKTGAKVITGTGPGQAALGAWQMGHVAGRYCKLLSTEFI